MMAGGHDLIASERGMWCICLAVVALILVLMKVLTGAEWVSFMQWVTITLVAAKTASGITRTRSQAEAPP